MESLPGLPAIFTLLAPSQSARRHFAVAAAPPAALAALHDAMGMDVALFVPR
jgi:hypothetical protein